MICRLWGELLGVERLGPADDFFECGGNSLQAAQFASRSLFSVEISLNDIFAHPSAERLSKFVHSRSRAESDPQPEAPAAERLAAQVDAISQANSEAGQGNALEEEIAQEWAVLLGLASVGIRDDFFELGGNSLQAAQFVASGRYGETLTLNDMFRCPTALSLGAFLRKRGVEENENE